MSTRLAVLFVLFLASAAQAAPLVAVRASAYCLCEKCCGVWAKYGKTKSGRKPIAGRTIAADPNVFPIGTRLRIAGRIYHVEDVGSAIRGFRVDIFHDSHEEAVVFGRQLLAAEVVK